MKKYGFLLSLVILLGFFFNVNAQESRTLSNGMTINLIAGFPSADFGAENNIVEQKAYSSLWGIQFGNRWYFSPQQLFGFGIMVNWIDFALAIKQGKQINKLGYSENWARTTFDLTLMGVGPLATIAVIDDMAFDIFYNLRPTILASGSATTDPTGSVEDATAGYGGFGLTNAIGSAFRWKALNLGVEYVFGSVNCQGKYDGPLGNGDLPDAKLHTNSIRILLGVKF